ncbi:hypothetical protein GTP58_03440 [Duganella sp. CY15W]|uniref:hypothetical protein n=1 Tax=Duganella TaxID=75654 RepID=UPI001114CD96|nr:MULTISPECIES: hypothetical protein [Duganella]MYM27374.1 hypothetical protein [Duganella sp. CY15W]
MKEAKNILKIFRQNPKVLQNPAVTSLDVAKKSRFIVLFFDSKQDIFEDSSPPQARIHSGFQSDLRVFVRQTPTGPARHFPT